jgi:hypothetical protein
MARNKFIKRLKLIAESLGYKVIFRRVSAMGETELGLTCPEFNRIYVDPDGNKDFASTIAHEIGHVLLLSCETPGHNIYDDTNFDLQIAENAADEIGAVLCRAIGCSSDFDSLPDKAKNSLEEAKHKYKNQQEYTAFLYGYCKALADTLPSSEVGLQDVTKKADEVFSGQRKYYRSRFPKRG